MIAREIESLDEVTSAIDMASGKTVARYSVLQAYSDSLLSLTAKRR